MFWTISFIIIALILGIISGYQFGKHSIKEDILKYIDHKKGIFRASGITYNNSPLEVVLEVVELNHTNVGTSKVEILDVQITSNSKYNSDPQLKEKIKLHIGNYLKTADIEWLDDNESRKRKIKELLGAK